MNTHKPDIAIAIYDLDSRAAHAVHDLQCAGFNMKRVSVIGWSGARAMAEELTDSGIPGDSVRRYAAALRAIKFMLVIHGDARDINRARELLETSGHERFDHHHVREEAMAHA
jgi:hypothetical protein